MAHLHDLLPTTIAVMYSGTTMVQMQQTLLQTAAIRSVKKSCLVAT